MKRAMTRWTSSWRGRLVAGAILAVLSGGVSAWALINGAGDRLIVANVEHNGVPFAEFTDGVLAGHHTQSVWTNLVLNGQTSAAFTRAVAMGDQMFAGAFSAAEGGGANVGAGSRYTRMPRADLTGAGQWATHTPARATGPNATACTGCHNQGGDDGGGDSADNVHRDGNHTGRLNQQVQRNTPHLFGLGGLQRLAEEMTVDIQNQRNGARNTLGCGANTTGGTTTVALSSKGVAFGSLAITHTAGSTNCTETLTPPAGNTANAVSADLVVRPFQWKGSVAFVRDFVRGALHNEIGMQASELLGSPTLDPSNVDGDGDGVFNEMFTGDVTALTLYNANQPRPTTRQELASLGLIPALSAQENADIAAGSTLFNNAGCASCHTRQLTVNDPIFREPSANPNFRDAGGVFPNGRPVNTLDPVHPVTFDITRDQQENTNVMVNGQKLGSFVRNAQGGATIALFGDLRRHDMGAGLAEEIDEVGTGPSVFMTENLWGCGTTPPYLHDGRAATLTEAILEHGGEAATSKNSFVNLTDVQKRQLITFLKNLVLFKQEG